MGKEAKLRWFGKEIGGEKVEIPDLDNLFKNSSYETRLRDDALSGGERGIGKCKIFF